MSGGRIAGSKNVTSAVSEKDRLLPLPERTPPHLDDLAQGPVRRHRLEHRIDRVLPLALIRPRDLVERSPHLRAVPRLLDLLQSLNLPPLRLEVDLQGLDRLLLLLDRVLVHPDDGILPRFRPLREPVRILSDLPLEVPRGYGLQDPARGLDSVEVLVGLLLHLLGQPLHVVGTPEGVDHARYARLLRDDLLRPQGHLHRLLGRKRPGLVEGVCVQRLRAPQNAGECLYRRPDDVVQGLLPREGGPRGLSVEPHKQAPRALRAVLLPHDGRPNPPRGPELRYLLEEVHRRVEEEAQPRGELVDLEPRLLPELHVSEAVGKSEGQLLNRA